MKKCTSVIVLLVGVLLFSGKQAAAQAKADSAAQTAAVQSRITRAVDETQLTQLKGNVHPAARHAELDKGVVDAAQPVTRAMVLLQRSADQETALRQLLDDQQNKSSSNYHAWLTPDQFGKQFGPSDSDVQTVTQWLTSHGFQNIKVAPGKTAIEFSGNVGQVREAFHTDIHKFMVRGEMRNANISDPQIPTALTPVVAGIVGLHNIPPRAHFHRMGTFRRTKATGEVKPLFTFSGGTCSGTGSCFAVGPGDFATIYNLPTNYTGAGVTIALVGDSNINIQDAHDFRSMFGLPTNDPTVIVNGPDPGLSGDEGEADLDVQWSGAVAPGANIVLVVTEQPMSGVGASGVDLSALYIINNNLAAVMSKSFGACEVSEGSTGNALEAALYEQASAQGITVMVSSGDNGSAGCDPTTANPDVASQGLAISGDASTPFNTAVGGTDFNQNAGNISMFWNTTNTNGTGASAKGYIPEMTWNDSCASTGQASNCSSTTITNDEKSNPGIDVVAGSGGASIVYTKPSWQTGTGVPNDGARDIPDVSLFASNGISGSFYIVCQQDQNTGTGSSTSSCNLNSPFNDFQGVGGTSASSPAFAGIIALVNQKTGQRQGNVNYVLYPLAAQAGATCTSAASPASTCIFYDTPAGSNISVACLGGSTDCSNTSTASNSFGIMTTSSGGSTPAYQTGAGYDLATGLGSVNVTNLLNSWTAASFRGTNITFSLNGGTPVVTTHGTAINVSGTVTPQSGTGTPTGFVELIQGTTAPGVVIDTFQVGTNGAYSGTTSMLPGSATAYQVIAHYEGDGTFAASNSAAQTVTTVTKENSAVKVSLVTFASNGTPIPTTSATSLPYGTNYILQIAVTNSGAVACVPPPFTGGGACPTGTITLLDGGQALNDFLVPNTSTATNTAKLNNVGVAEDQPIQLSAGSHTITATYAGDASFNAQPTSNSLSLTITQATTATAVTSSATSISSGGSVTLTANVSSNSNSTQGPTGTVQFFNGSTAIGSAATCTATGATASAGASCKATLTTTLSMLLPPGSNSRRRLSPPWGPLVLLAFVAMFLAYAATRMAGSRPRGYAYATAILLIAGAIGFAGCGGGSSGGGGGGSHTDSITAKYVGDTNYSSSTSTAVSITVQ